MASSSSSSLPSENENKHPFQKYEDPGPTGAYEARQVKNSGFYVRVDMPGVPPDGVKLVKYAETQTVTFSGKAPKIWQVYDSSERVYGGYVVLDLDPTQIDIEMKVKNGSMRLFFPGSEGTLHFLSGLKQAPNVEGPGEDASVVYTETDGCQSCFTLGDSVSPTKAFSHINPFLIKGVEGVYENRVIKEMTGESLYIRVDMPGIGKNQCKVKVDNTETKTDALFHGGKGKKAHGFCTVENRIDVLFYGGEGKKEHPLDQGGRSYSGSFTLNCDCCQIVDVPHQMLDGVLRLLMRKQKIQDILDIMRMNRRKRR
ncbi:putative 57 kDa heat shock protein isoform X2 [Silene latifolia]|uniref:putative 57 kDa heat shock protein isoform X2 n=1 Tax=Silene latifolia TaxID=37657 RepID=UPI003D7824B9